MLSIDGKCTCKSKVLSNYMALNHITNDIGIFAESLFLQNYRLQWGKYTQDCQSPTTKVVGLRLKSSWLQ
jgi:hypothetical protein